MLSIVGAGPGHVKYLTQAAIDTIRRADTVLAFGRIAETAEALGVAVIRIKSVSEVLEYVPSDRRLVLLASGDPCFYGIPEYLKKQHIAIDYIIPGLSSFQYFMAKLQKSWQHAGFVSLHGRENGLDEVLAYDISVVLTDRRHTPQVISQRLHQMGVLGKLYIGYNLSYENERIEETQIGDPVETCSELSVVIVERYGKNRHS